MLPSYRFARAGCAGRRCWKMKTESAWGALPIRLRLRLPSLRRHRLGSGQMRPGEFDDGVEGGRVADGQFAEHLSVQLDPGVDKGGDEAVVADAALAEGGAE